MGKAMIIFGFWMVICSICMIYQESVQDVDPSLTFGYAIFGSGNTLTPYLERTNSNQLVFNDSLSGTLPTRSSTGTDTGDVAYPDWTQSVFSWTSIFTPVINFVGTPYYLFTFMYPGSTAAILGGLLSILNLFAIVGWITGRID